MTAIVIPTRPGCPRHRECNGTIGYTEEEQRQARRRDPRITLEPIGLRPCPKCDPCPKCAGANYDCYVCINTRRVPKQAEPAPALAQATIEVEGFSEDVP